MPTEIKIPKLGLTMTEAKLIEWSIGAGDSVAADQIVCVIETDKVSLEIQSPTEGLLHPIAEAGKRVAIGEVIGYIAEDENALEALQARVAAVATRVAQPSETPSDEKVPAERDEVPPAPERPKHPPDGRIIASPAAKKASRSLDVDLWTVSGSGPGGRIVLADVQKAAEALEMQRSDAMYDFASAAEESEMLTVSDRIAVRGIRKIIAKNMKLSLYSQAQLTLHTEASAVALRDTRTLLNAHIEEGQPRISYNAIILKAAAAALRLYPLLNSAMDGHAIKVWEQIHIGVAVDFGKGLMVPKIRNPDVKSIRQITDELDDLVSRAENNRLLPDELQGGTFTITNLGNWEIDHFTPINNFPESAILGVGRIVEKPWVREGAVVAEPRMALSLTFDHRIIDGALGARFLKAIKDRVEEPRLML